MSSVFDPDMAAAGPASQARPDRIFFTAMGAAVALVVFAGFSRTYYLSRWLNPPERAPEMTTLLHLHAAVFTLWILLGAVQPALVAGGRIALHRSLGIAGAALALLVWSLGNVVSIAAMNVGYQGVGDPFAFYAVTFFSMQAFGITVLLGIWKRGKADTHKRLMLLSSAAILEAAIGRLPLGIVAQTAPFFFYIGADLVILAGMAYDRATSGRIHPVWLWGGGALVLSQIFRVAVMNSDWWLAFARAMARLV